MRLGLVNYYNQHGHKVHLTRARPAEGNSQMLGSFAETYDYVLLDGRRLAPTTRSKRRSAGSSIIQFQFNGEPYAGEIRVIFRHKQTGPAPVDYDDNGSGAVPSTVSTAFKADTCTSQFPSTLLAYGMGNSTR
ncbi:hypothetical protein B0H17DRAFT_1123966 [Mycena rosella]|uniref:Uncharacterized protein n=1 Tax=Mycena rosella TaxID=1033263 RepID=A0AAD7H3E5_MYCRO|nr:hypothetical protein B0H17DRAFT_1123966 [Mycena rosella]